LFLVPLEKYIKQMQKWKGNDFRLTPFSTKQLVKSFIYQLSRKIERLERELEKAKSEKKACERYLKLIEKQLNLYGTKIN